MSVLSFLVPWHPSPTVVVVTVVVAWLYVRGCRRTSVSPGAQVSFWVGLVILYVGWHTQLDYYAERQFFMHRIQQALLRDVGPLVIALGAPRRILQAGLPQWVQQRVLPPLARSRLLRAGWRLLTRPVVNILLYGGLEWFWLQPTVHFYAMLDIHLYHAMNWSMTLDGLLFWSLVLDPRPSPPARLAPIVRLMLAAAVMPLEMAPGVLLTFATKDYYPLYALCGRAFQGVSAHQDQSLGGLIIWIPGSFITLIGAMVALYNLFYSPGATAALPEEPAGHAPAGPPAAGANST